MPELDDDLIEDVTPRYRETGRSGKVTFPIAATLWLEDVDVDPGDDKLNIRIFLNRILVSN